jgi:hypothetical protein
LHKSDEATGRTIDRPNDKLLQHSKSSFGEPIVSARSTREQVAAAFVKAVLEPIIHGEMNSQRNLLFLPWANLWRQSLQLQSSRCQKA